MNRIVLLFVVLIGLSGAIFAQPENAVIEKIDGKKYYVHIVQQGNTLYGIHQLYKTPVETLLNTNKGLSNNLVVGQRVLIPIKTTDKNHYGTHTVTQGETLYGISKKYKCSVDDLMALNNDLSDGLSIGQQITVPKTEGKPVKINGEVIQSDPVAIQPIADATSEKKENDYKLSLKDSIVEHTVLPHETLYAIAKRYMVSPDTIMSINGLRNSRIKKGNVLKIPVKSVNYEVVEKELEALTSEGSMGIITTPTVFKETYHVALMLPLMLDKNEQQMGKSLRMGQVREMYKTTKISFDFYQGFLMAADSLAKAGMNVSLHVYDTKKDTNTIRKYFNQPEFKEMDLVVGPLFRSTIKYTTKLCAQKKIRVVLPFSTDSDVLYHNPYVYKGVASNMTLLDGAVDYLVENHKQHNIILIKPTSAADLALYERVRERFNREIKGMSGAYNLTIVESGLGSSSGRDLNNIIKKDTTNIVIVPSTNLTFVSGAMGRINKVLNMNPYAGNMKVIAFGLEEWNKFEDLDMKYRNRSYQHYVSYRYLDFESEKSIKYIKAYRKANGTDPNVYSSQGFDYGMYFLSLLHLHGTNFDQEIGAYKMELIQNDFQFKTIQNGDGKENQRICIIKYDNYHLIKLK